MRYPESHKAEVRERIIQSAAATLRREGIAGVSIPALMKQVGLTHGGFYGHFRDRDELVAAAVTFAGAETARSVFTGDESLAVVLERYLSEDHVAHPEHGCVVAALGAEGVHQDPAVRQAFSEVAKGFIDLVGRKLAREGDECPSTDRALRLASTMVGAVVLARLVDDPPLARRILAAARA